MNILNYMKSILFAITYILASTNCVKWASDGRTLASTDSHGTAKITDFGSGEVYYTGVTSDRSI